MRRGALKSGFKSWGKRLLRSDLFQRIAARVVHGTLSFVWRTNRPVAGSDDLATAFAASDGPVIVALWHGQQALAQFTRPATAPTVALVSRSADAEINARVLELDGVEVIRGSGGRDRRAGARKGGVQALIALRNALRDGRNVVMIADISKGAAREAGDGVVRLAKLSGRPILPAALATSRYYVFEKAWDRMTVNLPFGRRCLRLGAPIHVSGDADESALAEARTRLTDALNEVTRKAYAEVEDGR